MENKKATVAQVYDLLMSQKFVNWYESDFMDYVTGEVNAPPKEKIISDIAKLTRAK